MNQDAGSSSKRRLWALAPAIAAFLAYASTLGAGFVYDDQKLIVENEWVHDAGKLWQLPAKPLLASSGASITNYYRPVVNIAYNLMWQSFGGRPVAFHLLNVLTHMANATLLMMLVSRLAGRQGLVAIGAAALFAVHPLTSEAVAWPSCLPELSYVAFGLSALVVHVSSWTADAERAKRLRLASFALIGLACGCKETALAFVPMIFMLELWVRPGGETSVTAAIRAAVPGAIAAALFLGARTAVLGGFVPHGASGFRTRLDAVWNAPILLVRYLRMMVFPWPLRVGHHVTLASSAADPRFLVGSAVVLAGAAGVYVLRRVRPDLAFAGVLTVLPLLPALYLPALGRDPFAERYAYLAVGGFCWLLFGGASALAERSAPWRHAWLGPAVVYLLAIAAAATTVRRSGDWLDDGTLGRAEIRAEPGVPIGYLLQAGWLMRQNKEIDAYAVYRKGLDQAPGSVELQYQTINLGVQLHRLTHDDVMAEYERLVPLSKDNAAAEFSLGQALLDGGRLDAASKAFSRALEIAPDSVTSMNALAEIAARQGDLPAAITMLERAVAADPTDKNLQNRLAEVRRRSERSP